jgi:predicted DNA-binding mobile mystery protein A
MREAISMKVDLNSLAYAQIDKRLDAIREIKNKSSVTNGWIKYIRRAMGMTLNELGELTGLSARTIAQAEKREVEGKVTLGTLKKMAKAMECDLVYSLVPKKSVKQTIQDKARDKAIERLNEAGLHMKLEAQEVSGDFKDRVERLANKLIANGDVW